MNILMLFLSDCKPNATEYSYKYLNNREYTGSQTNDAPVKCLFDVAGTIDMVLCITSSLVYYGGKKQGKPVEPYFPKFKAFLRALNPKVEVKPIPYDFILGDKSSLPNNLRLNYILVQIQNYIKDINDANVFIDYTGGFRDVSFLMTSIIQYFELLNVSCAKIVYSDFFAEPKRIHEIDDIYSITKLIRGVHEFLNTGNATQLEIVLSEKELCTELGDLVENIVSFSNIMKLCDISKIDQAWKNLRKSLSDFESKSTSELMSSLLKSLVPTIKSKMYIETQGLDYIKMIQWCLDNGLIQQAVTLYIEKMPFVYFDKLIPAAIVDLSKVQPKMPGVTKESDGFYVNLFDFFVNNIISDKDDESVRFFKKVKPIIENQSLPKKFVSELRASKMGEASDRLCNFVEAYYVRKEDRTGISIDGSGNIPKNFEGFVSQFLTKSAQYSQYFVECRPKEKAKVVSAKTNGLTTYTKKVQALQNISISNFGINKTLYFQVMSHYLAVKLIRNRMNHAAESLSTDEKYAIKYLSDKGLNVDDYNLGNICTIIQNGININL